jgi:predicted dehydrogenase
MKFVIIGLGSMGKRRIRNLKALDYESILGFDPRKDRCEEAYEKYGIDTFQKINDVIEQKPDVMIISTPPDLHMKYAKIALENNIHFFTEASVVQDEMLEIIEGLKDSKIVGLPSCTLRFHPIVQKINEILQMPDMGKPLSFIHHFGQYLPDWHPWENYKEFYVSKKETGACREIVPFQLVWLISTFGKIKSVSGRKSKLSNLEIEIDDIYNVLLEFKNGIEGILIVDVISRAPFLQAKIMTENGVIIADWLEEKVKKYSHENGWEIFDINAGNIEKQYIHGEGPYIEEMKNFVQVICNKRTSNYSYEEDLKILKILESIEKSCDKQITENIN